MPELAVLSLRARRGQAQALRSGALRIVYYPDPVLLRPAAPVEGTPEDLDEIVAGMRRVMELERGIGLAAPQVGLSKRIVLVNPTGGSEDEVVLINPRITRYYGKKEWGEEGCLSFPQIWASVLRHTMVDVAYVNAEGDDCHLDADGLLARVLQHEIDHLDGQIFVNKMRPADKKTNQARLQELQDRYEALRERS